MDNAAAPAIADDSANTAPVSQADLFEMGFP